MTDEELMESYFGDEYDPPESTQPKTVTVLNQTFPAWTLEDYRDSDKPYVWILNHSSSRLQRDMYIDAHREHAISLGFQKFNSRLKAVRDDRNTRRKSAGEFDRRFATVDAPDGEQREILLETPWGISDDGITDGENVLCRQPMLPVKRSVDVETGEMRITLRYKRKGRQLYEEIDMPKAALGDVRRFSEYSRFGPAINAQNARKLTAFLSDTLELNDDIIPQELFASRFGYIRGFGFSPYVEGLQFKGSDDQNKLVTAVTSSAGTMDGWRRAALGATSGSLYARLCLAASLASPLLVVTNSLPFFVHFWGDSGCGKTVALKFAASAWGNPDRGAGLISTFSDTLNALVGRAAVLNQIPLAIDEAEMLTRNADAGKIVYTLAEGIEKGRATKDGTARNSRRWACNMITCGEGQLSTSSTGAGGIGRIIDIQIPHDTYFIGGSRREAETALKDFCRDIDRNYGFAGAAFTAELYKRENLEKVRKRERELRTRLMRLNVMDKQCDSAACMITAYELFRETCMPELPELTLDDIIPCLEDRNAASIGKRGYDFICGWIVENSACFVAENPIVAGADEGIPSRIYGRMLGGGRVFVLADRLDQALTDAGFGNVSAVYSWMAVNGVLMTRACRGKASASYRKPERIVKGSHASCYDILVPTDEDPDEDPA